jgi:alpha-glucosidase
MKPALSALACLVSAGALQANEPLVVSSPDGRIELQIPAAHSSPQDHRPDFQIRFRGQALLEGKLGLSVHGSNLLEKAVQKKSARRRSDSTYRVPFGKSNPVRDQFNEMTLDIETSADPVRKIQVIFRVYDDGVAFRHVIPQQAGVETVEITDEPDRFQLVGNPQTWPLYRENYTTSHEGLYASERLSTMAINRLIDLPLLAEYDDGVSLALTEANLRNYAGMYLKAEGDGKQRRLRCDLSPLPGSKEVKVRARLPLSSPWRVILIGTSPGRLIESNLILNLNEPIAVADTSWLKPGKTTWYWWNGPYQEPVDFTIGLNWETMKHYIDFCDRNGITSHSIMSTVDEFPWYHQSQNGYAPGPDSDITKPRTGLDMERVMAYARSKNVGIRLWVHWKPLSEHLEDAFAQYEKWGVQGLMVDFLDRDDQEMVLFAEHVLQSAVRHHLQIHFHGVWKPTGLQRTYPNLMNHEGVLNLEYLKWGDECAPPHNVTVAFTRMLAGPMDYHLGGFRSANRDQFKPTVFKPSVLGTRCHHLAMYVVFENPMPMVCDAPTAYEGQPGFDFIRQVPTTWDETRVLNGKVGNYIVVARRKGADWYLGAMTDWTPRVLEVPLNFLARGRYSVDAWADVAGSEDPNRLGFNKRTVNTTEKLELRLNSGGGQAICIRPARE